jgi:tetratricopeptide (TPR) repeat protein
VDLERAAGRRNDERLSQLAAATALDGDTSAALALFDEILASQRLAEPLANRGALRAARGDLAGAEADLRDALETNPEMVPAWRNLARVLERSGREYEAREARARASRQACRAPRGYPYGLGTGEVLEWGVGRRWLLLWEQGREAPAQRGGAERRRAPARAEGRGALALRAALPSFYREACRRLRGPASEGA